MKRLVALTLAGLVLALPATALAGQSSEMLARFGSGYSSKKTSGSCTVARSKLLHTATLRCADGTGAAVARYTFKLSGDSSGSISPHVDFAAGSASVSVSRPDKGTAIVTVRTSGRSRVVIAMVSVTYYCS